MAWDLLQICHGQHINLFIYLHSASCPLKHSRRPQPWIDGDATLHIRQWPAELGYVCVCVCVMGEITRNSPLVCWRFWIRIQQNHETTILINTAWLIYWRVWRWLHVTPSWSSSIHGTPRCKCRLPYLLDHDWFESFGVTVSIKRYWRPTGGRAVAPMQHHRAQQMGHYWYNLYNNDTVPYQFAPHWATRKVANGKNSYDTRNFILHLVHPFNIGVAPTRL